MIRARFLRDKGLVLSPGKPLRWAEVLAECKRDLDWVLRKRHD